jgi:cyclohexanecarboxyl-CoA dehydrogenase
VINGEKTSITFADRADAYLIFARTGTPEQGAKGVSAFFIPASRAGHPDARSSTTSAAP